jgi:hypothetical protein
MNATRPDDAHKTLAFAASMAALDSMTITQLQIRWREVFDEPCRSRNRQYLVKRLRYRIQEQAHGGLSDAARQRILTLAATSTLRQRPPQPPSPAHNASISAIEPLVATPSAITAPQPPAPESNPNLPAHDPPQELSAASTHPLDARLPAPGSVLRRIYQDKVYEVKVLHDGFEYLGQQHKSLSRIARLITGTGWNGFAFFKLDSHKHPEG